MDEMREPAGSPTGSSTDSGTTGASSGSPSGAGGGSADETFGWTSEDEAGGGTSADARAAAEKMLGQLQSMIDTIAVQAAPVVRQIGAKAAELAAVAADRAGPLAHRAADATAGASERLAEKSRTWAADLRSRTGTNGNGHPDDDLSSVPLSGADDAEERSAKDDPVEGTRS